MWALKPDGGRKVPLRWHHVTHAVDRRAIGHRGRAGAAGRAVFEVGEVAHRQAHAPQRGPRLARERVVDDPTRGLRRRARPRAKEIHMIVSRFQVGTFSIWVVAISAILVWEIRENRQLRSQAAGQSRSSPASIAALERQVAAESRRVAAAEAKVATLL